MAMTLTHDDINALKGIFATKEDLQGFATKEDLQGFATKDDLRSLVTKEDLQSLATKDDLQEFATKKDSEEIIGLLNEVILLVDDRFGRLEARTTLIEKHLSRKRAFPRLKQNQPVA